MLMDNLRFAEWVYAHTISFNAQFFLQSFLYGCENGGVCILQINQAIDGSEQKKHKSNLSVGAHSNKWIKHTQGKRSTATYNLNFCIIFTSIINGMHRNIKLSCPFACTLANFKQLLLHAKIGDSRPSLSSTWACVYRLINANEIANWIYAHLQQRKKGMQRNRPVPWLHKTLLKNYTNPLIYGVDASQTNRGIWFHLNLCLVSAFATGRDFLLLKSF